MNAIFYTEDFVLYKYTINRTTIFFSTYMASQSGRAQKLFSIGLILLQ